MNEKTKKTENNVVDAEVVEIEEVKEEKSFGKKAKDFSKGIVEKGFNGFKKHWKGIAISAGSVVATLVVKGLLDNANEDDDYIDYDYDETTGEYTPKVDGLIPETDTIAIDDDAQLSEIVQEGTTEKD